MHRAVWLLVGLLAFSLPPSAWADALAGSDSVFPNADAVQPLAVGHSIPSSTVRTIEGESVDLATRLGNRGALLVFYRGGW